MDYCSIFFKCNIAVQEVSQNINTQLISITIFLFFLFLVVK